MRGPDAEAQPVVISAAQTKAATVFLNMLIS
jgi:hypothetical protein